MKLTKRIQLKAQQTALTRETLVERYSAWRFTPHPDALLYGALISAFLSGFVFRRLHVNWKRIPRLGLSYIFPAMNLVRFE